MPVFPGGTTYTAALSIFIVLSGLPGMARGELRFPQPDVDMGQVRSGKPFTHRFTFLNAGDQPVEIIDARATCGCLAPRVSQRIYQPGERGELELEVNTLSQPPGPHRWVVFVRYRLGMTAKEVTLRLSADVVTEVMVQPAALFLYGDQAIAHDVILTDLRSKPLTITDLRASSLKVKPRLLPAERDSAGHWQRRIRVEVAFDCPAGRHDELLSISTDDPGYRELRVPVTIVKRPDQRLTVAPSEVTLTALPGVPPPSRIVQLRDSQQQPVIIERITAEDPAIVCKWSEGPGNHATIRIQVDRARIMGNELTSTVRIEVSQPVRETITLPVKCLLE